MKRSFLALALITPLAGCEALFLGPVGAFNIAKYMSEVPGHVLTYESTGTSVVMEGAVYPVMTRYVAHGETGEFVYLERVVEIDGNIIECGDSCWNAAEFFLSKQG